ncbi:probable glutathione S-transferase GSTF1 [Dendrobium catenatum]|uniref:glutathione transferase n=1 Tax=Dendrobium catenatum TaxID=906689 RepID=A0A2I0WHF8_9ASPA|nr:probable glutathione S-transferase GSTF1 [Dendrobium catenatum]PKU75100.1 putative glutathione S-transferase GSTF1 [Dendrobium catenatum]
MVLKVFGNPISTCTVRVLACIEEIGLEYELVPVDLTTGEHKRPPHIHRNPFGQIPALQDGDLILFESRVINRYLVRKYGKGTDLLREESLVDSVSVDQWMEVETQHFNGPISTLVFQHVFLPIFFGGSTDEKVVAAEAEKLGKVLDVYEAKLSKTKFLAGDFYSLADLHHLSYVHYLITSTPHGSLFHSRPHVKAWWDAISSRPASKKVLAALSFSS